ncbi:MAG: hypothetical protein IT462_15035 [Planctomycetes bacterium]|nr:hypothetical protein [Planctomycetota bacterium]
MRNYHVGKTKLPQIGLAVLLQVLCLRMVMADPTDPTEPARPDPGEPSPPDATPEPESVNRVCPADVSKQKKNVKSLYCDDFTDDDLAKLTEFKDLEELDLGDSTTLTGKGLASLKPLQHLRQIRFGFRSWGKAELADLSGIQELPALRVLDLGGWSVISKAWGQEFASATLEELHLTGTLCDSAHAISKLSCPKLKLFSLRAATIDDPVFLSKLDKLKLLETLDLSHSIIKRPHAFWNVLVGLTNVRNFNGYGCVLSHDAAANDKLALATLAKHSRIETIDLNLCKIEADALADLAALPKLKALNVSFASLEDDSAWDDALTPILKACKITDIGVAGLRGFEGRVLNLVSDSGPSRIHVSFNDGLTEEVATAIVKRTQLTSLRARRCPAFSDKHLTLLREANDNCIEEIELGSKTITGAGLAELGMMPTLKRVVLDGRCKFDQTDVDALRKQLPSAEIEEDYSEDNH